MYTVTHPGIHLFRGMEATPETENKYKSIQKLAGTA